MLKRMATEEKVAVCLVLHQPSTSIFSMLDHLLLLTNGTLVYSGAPGAAVELYKTFGYTVADPSMNPADWLLDVAQGDVPNDLLRSSDPEQIVRDWRRHESATAPRRCFENVTSAGGGGAPLHGRSGRSWWAMYTTVLAREAILLWRREPWVVLLVTTGVGLLAGLVRHLSMDELHNLPRVSCLHARASFAGACKWTTSQ
jgi:hypothetical protein